MKPQKQNPDHIRCPLCLRGYGYFNFPFVDNSRGKREWMCADCGILREASLSTPKSEENLNLGV